MNRGRSAFWVSGPIKAGEGLRGRVLKPPQTGWRQESSEREEHGGSDWHVGNGVVMESGPDVSPPERRGIPYH